MEGIIVHCPLTSQCPKSGTNAALCTAFGRTLLEQAKERGFWETGPRAPCSTPHPATPPWHPALVFIIPFATRDYAAAVLLSSFPPVLPPPLSTLIQQVFIWSFAPSAAQILNTKKAGAPGLKQKCYLGYAATADFACITNLK